MFHRACLGYQKPHFIMDTWGWQTQQVFFARFPRNTRHANVIVLRKYSLKHFIWAQMWLRTSKLSLHGLLHLQTGTEHHVTKYPSYSVIIINRIPISGCKCSSYSSWGTNQKTRSMTQYTTFNRQAQLKDRTTYILKYDYRRKKKEFLSCPDKSLRKQRGSVL